MHGKWCLPLAVSGLALCAVLVLLFLTPSTAFAMVNTGNFQPSGIQGTSPLSTAYMNGYRQGYRSACSSAIGANTYPSTIGNSDYNAGYQQGYQYGAGNCSNQPAIGTPYGTTGTPYGTTGTPYGTSTTPYNGYGGYSSPNGSYTPAYGTNDAPLFNVQTNVTVSGNH